MSPRYIFRLDDICPEMNYVNFSRIRDIFFKNNIQPIIGIIPHNEDTKLTGQAGINAIDPALFWKEMKILQETKGWSVALHGYNHVYTTSDSGIFKVNKRAEFAGLSFEKQNEKISLGKAILEEHGLRINAFMAPAHSLDWNTVEALKKNGIYTITDGKSFFPYVKRGILFVPQIHPWPKKNGVGVHTVCLHINEWDKKKFDELEKIIKDVVGNRSVSFVSETAKCKKYTKVIYKIGAKISCIAIVFDNWIRRLLCSCPKIKNIITKILRK